MPYRPMNLEMHILQYIEMTEKGVRHEKLETGWNFDCSNNRKGCDCNFHDFEFKSGANWRYILYGADGNEFKNYIIFLKIDVPALGN